MEVFAPTGSFGQNCLDAVKDADLLGVCRGFHQGGPPGCKRRAGNRKLAAGGPNRRLGGILIFTFGQVLDPPHIIGVELLKLCQGAHRVTVDEGPHGLGAAIVLLDGQSLVGGHCVQPPIDTIGRAGKTVVAGKTPAARPQGTACAFAQIILPAKVLDGRSTATAQGRSIGREDQQTGEQCRSKQQGQQAFEILMLHGFPSFPGGKKADCFHSLPFCRGCSVDYLVDPGTSSSLRKAVASGASSVRLGNASASRMVWLWVASLSDTSTWSHRPSA